MNIASKANRYEILMRFKRQSVREKLHTLKFIFNCHVKTVALIICFKKLFVQVWAIPEVGFQTRSRSPPIDIGMSTCDPSYQIRGKNWKGETCLRKYSEKKWNRAFIIISSHDLHFHSNNHSLVAETGEGPGGSCHLPLFLDQTEARRTEKKIGETGPLLYLRDWMTAPPYLFEALQR